MTDAAAPQAPAAPPPPGDAAGAAAVGAPPSPGTGAPASPAKDQRVHVYEAVANQRHQVLSSFDAQREAIFKAVADQRAAALAPIHAVQAKLTVPAGSAGTGAARAAAGIRSPATPQQLIAADIVAALKALVADEVRAQLAVRLRAPGASADTPQRPASAPPGAAVTPPLANTALAATLKLMVAEEVAAQLDALMRAAAAPPPAANVL